MLVEFKQITTTLPLGDEPQNATLMKELTGLGSSEDEGRRRETILRGVCPSLGPILDLLRSSAPIGEMGAYCGVHRAIPVYAGFTPVDGANPAQGNIGKPESVQLIQFQTWAPGDVAHGVLSNFLSGLRLLHPYERPVIEITNSQQWVDDQPKNQLRALLGRGINSAEPTKMP